MFQVVRCRWWVRWRHRRKRASDVAHVFPHILRSCDSVERAVLAWKLFLLLEASGHWQCACASENRLSYPDQAFVIAQDLMSLDGEL